MFGTGGRRSMAGALVVVGLAAFPAVPAQAGPTSKAPALASKAPGFAPVHYGQLSGAGTANVRQLNGRVATGHPRLSRPAILRHAKAAAPSATKAARSTAAPGVFAPTTTQGTTEERLT